MHTDMPHVMGLCDCCVLNAMLFLRAEHNSTVSKRITQSPCIKNVKQKLKQRTSVHVCMLAWLLTPSQPAVHAVL